MKQLFILLVVFYSFFSFGQEEQTESPSISSITSYNFTWTPPCGERFYVNGSLLSRCDCVNDTIHGKYSIWDERGIKSSEETYVMGVLKKRVYWYTTGKIESVDYFYNRDHCYKQSRWSTEGFVQETHHFDWEGEYHGAQYTYFENGHLKEEQHYNHGKQKGIQKTYSKDLSILIIENKRENQLHGSYEKWNKGALIEKGNYENNQKQGVWRLHDPEHPQLYSEIYYDHDKKQLEKNFDKGILISSMNHLSGKFIAYDLNSIKRKEWSYINDNRSGLQQEWNEKGALISHYYVAHGKFCDSSIFYNRDGTYRRIDWAPYERIKNLQQGKGDVYSKEYLMSAKGDTLEQRLVLNSVDEYKIITNNPYVNNQKSGTWTIADLHTGVISKKVTYVNGVLEGPFSSWYDGRIEDGITLGGKAHVFTIKGNYANNLLEGDWIRSYSTNDTNVIVEKVYYKKGQLEGTYTEFSNTGAPIKFANYHLGQLHGSYQTQWPDGDTIEMGTYYLGAKQGFWKRYRDELMTEHGWTGRSEAYEGYYNLGVQEGYWKHYGPFGHLVSEGNYSNGKPDGHWIFYFKNYDLVDLDHPVKSSEGTLFGEKHLGIWKYYNEKGKLFDKAPYL